VPIIFAFHKRDKARAAAAEAAEEAAQAADGPHPAAALGTTPLLPPMGPITPGASSFYRRRRLPSSSPSGHLHAHHGGGSHSSSAAGGVGGVPGASGTTSLASELAAASSDRSLAGWILRFGRGRRRGEGGRAGPSQRRDSSDDSLV